MFYSENTIHESYKDDVPRKRIPYFYIHGRLEDEAGYDCCDATIEEIKYVTMKGVFLSTVKDITGKETRVLVCTYLQSNRINGLIVALDDTEDNIKYCINNLQTDSIYSHHVYELKNNHPNVYKLLKDYKNKQ